MQIQEESESLWLVLPVPVLLLSRDFGLIQANEAAQELFRSLTESGHFADPSLEIPAWLGVGAEVPAELPMVRSVAVGGTTRTFNVGWRSLEATPSVEAAWAVVLTEITVLQQAHAETAQRERACRQLLDHLPSIVWSLDDEFRFTACEGGLLKQYGSAPGQAIGRTLDEVFGPAGAEAETMAAHRRAFAGETVTYECGWGGRHFYSLVAPLHDAGKEVIGVALDITERVKEEEAVRRARDQAECLIQTANVLIVGLDVNGRVTVFNEAAERTTGYPVREVLGRNWFELFVPRSERAREQEGFATLLAAELRTEFTSPLVTRYGQRRVIAWRNSVISEGGETVGIVSVGQDVTDLSAVQERLRDSEERHRTLLASLPQRIFVKDQQGGFVSVNEPFAKDFGLRPKDLIGMSDFDFFGTELAEKYRADDRRVMETRATETIVEVNVVQGRERYVEVVKAPVITDDGNVRGIVGVFTDITERKRMEEELAHERDLLHTLMGNTPDQIYFKDQQSLFTRINPAAAKAIGFECPEDAVGCSDFEVHPHDLASEYFVDEQRLMQTGEPIVGKLEVQRQSDGTERWLSSTKVPIRDRTGAIVGVSGISRDVSDRIEVEEELRRTAAELARSNEELQQFAYVASHDLQEPLRMVASYTQLLARRYRDKLDDDGVEFINYAVDGATRMQGLIQDLLTYSRVGTRGDAFTPVALESAVARGLQNLKVALDETGAVISCDPLPTIHGDLGQLAQLFQNLIGNALKFRGAETPHVRISAERQGSAWVVSVADNGIGIEPEYAERIFVIFQRLHGKTDYPGSGIGLSICKKIVTRHGGKIWVERSAEGGSTFRFTLPGPTGKQDRAGVAASP